MFDIYVFIAMSTTFSNVSVESNRKLIRLTDKSYGITIPPEWIRMTEKTLLRKLEDVNLVMDSVVIVTPREKTDEYKNLLIAWEALSKHNKVLALNKIKAFNGSK